MKKILGIILGSLGCLVGLFILVNFPFMLMHSETKISEEDKTRIEQYAIDTFGEKLELVKYDRYSNSGGTREKFAIYKVNNREFEVGMRKITSSEEWEFYNTFVSDYILGIDDTLSKQISSQLKGISNNNNNTIEYVWDYYKYIDNSENINTRLKQYEKNIKNLTREEILYREKDNIKVTYRAELSPNSNMENFETAIYELYKVMKSSGMGKIDILIEFGSGNYQTGKFEFYKECDYPVNSLEDLKQFYTK